MNRIILIGNVTKDLELKQTSNGKSVTRFCIGVTRTFANQDGHKETDFFNIVVWGKQADNCCSYLAKGSKIAVTGSVQNRSYDGTDGQKHHITEVIADNVEFLNTKRDSEQDTDVDSLPELDEELPF